MDPEPSLLETTLRGRWRAREAGPPRAEVSAPLLAALGRTGTAHVYADTGDVAALTAIAAAAGDRVVAEIDGNTVNQPLVGKVVDRYLARPEVVACLDDVRGNADPRTAAPLVYAALVAWLGDDVLEAFAIGRRWDVSLQLHTDAMRDADAAVRIGCALHAAVPGVLVKVPFAPHAPACFLIARALERGGVPVNFTSTFSARQVALAALLADVSRTNVFMGRLNEGLAAELLGEHVVLEAQRALTELRHTARVRTQLIVASMRDWRTFVRLAGCDVFTAPCETIADFLAQTEVGPDDVRSQLATSYADRLDIAPGTRNALGEDRIARLHRVEPELVAFAADFRRSTEWASMRDGDALAWRLEREGFGDVFYAPTADEWETLSARKLPDLASPLAHTLALDTLYSLLADADFAKHQAEIDGKIARALAASTLSPRPAASGIP